MADATPVPPPSLKFGTAGFPQHGFKSSCPAITFVVGSRRPCNEAASFALCYGPEDCSPFTEKGFYIRAFIS